MVLKWSLVSQSKIVTITQYHNKIMFNLELDKKAMYKLESEALYNEICRLALEETNWTFEKEYVRLTFF